MHLKIYEIPTLTGFLFFFLFHVVNLQNSHLQVSDTNHFMLFLYGGTSLRRTEKGSPNYVATWQHEKERPRIH